MIKQGIALKGRNTTGPPAIIKLEAPWRHRLAFAGEAATNIIIARVVEWQECYKRRQMTYDREQNNTVPYALCRRASNKVLLHEINSRHRVLAH